MVVPASKLLVNHVSPSRGGHVTAAVDVEAATTPIGATSPTTAISRTSAARMRIPLSFPLIPVSLLPGMPEWPPGARILTRASSLGNGEPCPARPTCAVLHPAAVGCPIVAVDFTQEIKDLRATMDSVRGVTNLDELARTISELEEQASAPDLWDNPDQAQQVTSALSRANSERDRVMGMDARIDDLETLVEMGQEEHDAATLEEAERDLATLKKDVGDLEVRPLLSGEYDEREAVVTIRSGAGG